MDFELIIDSIPRLVDGAILTVWAVCFAFFISIIPAMLLARVRLSDNPLLHGPAFAYIYVFRGTPFVVQLFFFYYGLGQVEWLRESELLAPIFREAYYYGLLALVANTLAYQAEIVRGGILSVPKGEVEAARACGMSIAQVYRRVILPNAFRRSIPAYGNEFISLTKASAILSMITIMDLMGVAERINSRYYAPIEAYLAAGVFYLAIALAITYGMRGLEYWLTPHMRAAGQAPSKLNGLTMRLGR